MSPQPKYTSSVTNTAVFIAIPEGKRIRGRVKEVEGVESWPEQAHPKRKHPWREMLHNGKLGTGFVQCICGAVGVAYRRPR